MDDNKQIKDKQRQNKNLSFFVVSSSYPALDLLDIVLENVRCSTYWKEHWGYF